MKRSPVKRVLFFFALLIAVGALFQLTTPIASATSGPCTQRCDGHCFPWDQTACTASCGIHNVTSCAEWGFYGCCGF